MKIERRGISVNQGESLDVTAVVAIDGVADVSYVDHPSVADKVVLGECGMRKSEYKKQRQHEERVGPVHRCTPMPGVLTWRWTSGPSPGGASDGAAWRCDWS